jgi:hypothetical protein
MPGLIPLIKKIRPDLPIIYRSHIEIRSDLVHVPGSPQEEVWKYLWNNIQLADLFISKLLRCLYTFENFLTHLQVTPLANSFPVMSLSKSFVSSVLPLIGVYLLTGSESYF